MCCCVFEERFRVVKLLNVCLTKFMEQSPFDKLMTVDLGQKNSRFLRNTKGSTVYVTILSLEPVEFSPNSHCVS